jgi:hypothetical protein
MDKNGAANAKDSTIQATFDEPQDHGLGDEGEPAHKAEQKAVQDCHLSGNVHEAIKIKISNQMAPRFTREETPPDSNAEYSVLDQR